MQITNVKAIKVYPGDDTVYTLLRCLAGDPLSGDYVNVIMEDAFGEIVLQTFHRDEFWSKVGLTKEESVDIFSQLTSVNT